MSYVCRTSQEWMKYWRGNNYQVQCWKFTVYFFSSNAASVVNANVAVIKMNISQFSHCELFTGTLFSSPKSQVVGLFQFMDRKSLQQSQKYFVILSHSLAKTVCAGKTLHYDAGLTQQKKRNFHAFIKFLIQSFPLIQLWRSERSFIFIFPHSLSFLICWGWSVNTMKNSWEWKISRVHCHCHQCKGVEQCGICQASFSVSPTHSRD